MFPSLLSVPHELVLHSQLKRLLVSQSSRVSPDRSDRELAYMFKWHNDKIDVRRGIRKEDFMWGRTWSETKAKQLWTNIDGPCPGGNQHMAREECGGEGLPKVIFSFLFFFFLLFRVQIPAVVTCTFGRQTLRLIQKHAPTISG